MKKGCTQYFSNNETNRKIDKQYMSKDHLNKGPLNDHLVDDVKNFASTDKVSEITQ